MKRYREVDIVDNLDRLEKLIDVCSAAHELLANKNDAFYVLVSFGIPKLEEMREYLRIDNA